jgi:hypothetical protein
MTIADLRERAKTRARRRLSHFLSAFWVFCAIAAAYFLGFSPLK